MFSEDCQLAGSALQRRGGRAGARSEEAAVHEDLHDRRDKGPAKKGDHGTLSYRKTQRRKWDEEEKRWIKQGVVSGNRAKGKEQQESAPPLGRVATNSSDLNLRLRASLTIQPSGVNIAKEVSLGDIRSNLRGGSPGESVLLPLK